MTRLNASTPDALLVPAEVIFDPKLSLADLGLYVKIAQLQQILNDDVDSMVAELLQGRFGQRVDVREEEIRAGIQRLADARYFELF